MNDHPTWAEVDLGAIAHNVKEIKRIISPGATMMAVVKANGYGHGMVEVARTALSNGAARLAVARASEGTILRRAGINVPVLVLGYTPPGMFSEIIDSGLTQTVFSLQYAQILDRECRSKGVRLPVHIKVDTGMGRIGLVCGNNQTVADILDIARMPGLDVEGVYTHFASADSSERKYTLQQFEKFTEILVCLSREGLFVPVRHCANSAAIIEYPETHLDMVRPGIILYGLYPSPDVDHGKIILHPAMSFKTSVAMVKRVSRGFNVSYGCTYTTGRSTLIASLSAGYADGYPRSLSSLGDVLIKGRRAPVIGRVCMDQLMVDVGHIEDVLPGEEAVLFGIQAGSVLPVEEVADKIGTINYEIVCMVGARVPRIFIR